MHGRAGRQDDEDINHTAARIAWFVTNWEDLRCARIALTMLVGFAVGGVAVQGVHAQSKVVPPRLGVVTAINYAGKTFTCHWKTSDWTYQTNDKTVFFVDNKKKAAFTDLKVGETVQTNYHLIGKDRIADRVTITAP